MTKDTKTPSPSTPSKSTTSSTAAPRKKLTLNTTAFQKKLSTISVNNILEEEPDYEKMPSLARTKRAREKQKTKYQPKLTSSQKIVREVDIPVKISIQELASRMSEKTGDVVKALMKNGIMATANQYIDGDTAELIVTELGHTPKREAAISLNDEIASHQKTSNSKMQPRPPIVTVMGHVDHGKTSLLDSLRNTNVTARESGGITQHIGAYQIQHKKTPITFLDTPGHAAFSNIRSRGASLTDVVVLVVAANDSVKPQTIEAISHAKTAKVPIVLAINKMDLPDVDPNVVRNDLLSHEVVVETFSGDVLETEISAVKKTNLDKLLDNILLQVEILDLNVEHNKLAEAIVVESKIETGKGSVATVIIKNGTLKEGDHFTCGSSFGRVKALFDEEGKRVKSAPPGMPVEVLGFDSIPQAGETVFALPNEEIAKSVTEKVKEQKKLEETAAIKKSSLEELMANVSKGEVKKLPIIVKADVQGSLEAIVSSLEKVGNDEVKMNVIHNAIGAINESDVSLANSAQGVVIGFNIRAIPQARTIAKRDKVDIRYYSIIYELIDDMKKMLSGLLTPDTKEEIIGHAEVRDTFSSSKLGTIAGCYVTNGLVSNSAKIRLVREGKIIHEGEVGTLKRFKDDVKEVRENYECGISFKDYSDILVKDEIEFYITKEVQKEL
ncbi:translation initiation factor IF-2 [Alphaproteobacteria bacterium]|jgi:translation initiation factor IF-2|nr:translation initiation factor IF-2 [Alphaproteobacteria bacterium]MDB2564501.1 translation initiation factor IF-2 [Alphaproteobacteria bacterium]MDB3863641.1 translation initiation factor IF-2 [Alphaproteobacteria bacterium]MDC0967474.1 translation initiation factor IF-2 [Alphaproteobacteria bacterium]